MSLSNKFKKNKGITLIEIIISVALLAILFVPASSIILNMIRGNIKAENRQQAAYLGQNILDELSDDMNFTIRSDDKGDYFNLLNGEKKNMLVIYLQDEEKKEYVDIKINNKSDEIIDIYVIKENIDSSLKVSIRGKQGNVYYLPVKEEYVSGEIYGVSVIVKEKRYEDILFEGHIVSKISFN